MIPGFTTVTTLAQLDRLLPQADTLICCLPETAETRGLLSRARIVQMKQGSVLINVGRGSLVDTEALTQALQAGRLAGAGLDARRAVLAGAGAVIIPHLLHDFAPHSQYPHHLATKKPDVTDIRLICAWFQPCSRDAAAVPMAEAFCTGLHTQ